VLRRVQVDTIIFLHIAKCGGTSFNKRLTSIEAQPPCSCRASASNETHNGHALVAPASCYCPRAVAPSVRFSPAVRQLPRGINPRAWQFLQRQWLVSPETTGWLGGVHAPLRVLQLYVMLSAKMASRRSLASGLYYVTVLREPTRRFLSEFYETFDGWEAKYNTPPRVIWPCSNSLPSELKAIARAGIDNSTKEEYDRLFPYWIGCSRNMAANRQVQGSIQEALALSQLIKLQRSACT